MSKLIYTLLIKNDDVTLRWSYDQDAILGYVYSNKIKNKHWKMIPMTEEQFESYKENTTRSIDEIIDFRDGVYITESEEEMYFCQIDHDIDQLIRDMEDLVKRLTYLKGDDVKKAIKALNKLLHDPDLPESSAYARDEVDDETPFYILSEKIKIKKYLDILKYGEGGKKKFKKLNMY